MIKDFANAIRDHEAALPNDILNAGGRFNVYRRNYFSRLIDVLGEVFPVVKQLVGQEFFDAMAQEYATLFPPTSPLLVEYGKHFSEFLEDFEPAHQVPYLPDMARLEWARSTSQNGSFLPSNHISTAEDILRALNRPVMRAPNATLVKSFYPVGTIWTHHQREVPEPVSNWSGETVAIWHVNGDLHQVVIQGQEQEIFSAIRDGTPFINDLEKIEDEQKATFMIEVFVKYINLGLLIIANPETEK
ncbi:putative DNA-binding domain-containing protein [Sneathiella limimaris]|uniref:HvfC/BufC family peptide modification chaperone n=1 Tax=Sneathiella limimaris TaxID=1964213 RepID=UPI00146D88A9